MAKGKITKKEKVVEVRDLKKTFGKTKAVDGVSFEVFKGEIFGLIGPNGAGKTTTLEIIETLQNKDSGEVIVLGLDIDKSNNANEVRSQIGVQLQAAGYPADVNLKQILEFFAALYNVRVDAHKLLKKFDLEDKAKSKYKELSGGQKQRFSILTTIVHNPQIIFLDEPSTGLDPHARRVLWDMIREIRNSGTTVIITTHFMDEAEILCDRVAIIDKGKVLKINTPELLIEDLLSSGFKANKKVKAATLDDVFIDLTGKEIYEVQK